VKKTFFVFFVVFSIGLSAQNDTIVVKNGNVLYGEIKKLRSSVLKMETPYSDSDFSIDFNEVVEIKIQKLCFVILTGGRRLTGYIRSEKPNEFTFTDRFGNKSTYKINELVVLDELDDLFWKRISGYIDLSYNLTKANNTSQLTIGGGLSYRGPKWVSSAKINALNSNQDNTEQISRTDINAELQRTLTSKWYLLSNLSYLSNTEQSLDARYAIRVGGGRYMALTNKLSWGLNAGLNFNIEDFSDATTDRESAELFIGTNLDMFDYKDWSLKTNINVFPSLSESGRWRVDYNLDIKWDLPLDFYVKTSLQFNYDNRAASTGSDFDYIWTSGVGWSFN
jgi:hypothetical protein